MVILGTPPHTAAVFSPGVATYHLSSSGSRSQSILVLKTKFLLIIFSTPASFCGLHLYILYSSNSSIEFRKLNDVTGRTTLLLRIPLVQKVRKNDPLWLEFCPEFKANIEDNEFSEKLWMSDDARFHDPGPVKKHGKGMDTFRCCNLHEARFQDDGSTSHTAR